MSTPWRPLYNPIAEELEAEARRLERAGGLDSMELAEDGWPLLDDEEEVLGD